MIVQNLYHANLKIDAEGSVSLESAWELALEEPASGLEQLQAEARGWAGGIVSAAVDGIRVAEQIAAGPGPLTSPPHPG